MGGHGVTCAVSEARNSEHEIQLRVTARRTRGQIVFLEVPIWVTSPRREYDLGGEENWPDFFVFGLNG